LLRPDFIFCTGDIAFGQTPSFSLSLQYKAIAGFFDQLLQVCGSNGIPLSRDRLFVVPGNHDLDLGLVNSLVQDQLRAIADDCHNQFGRINRFISENSIEFRNASACLSEYGRFVDEYLPHQADKDGRNLYSAVQQIDGINVGIAGFNSAWSCSGKSDANLWLGAEYQFNRARHGLASADLRIGLIHHPTDWLNLEERQSAKHRIAADFDFWLHGHSHDMWVDQMLDNIVVGAGAVGADTSDEFGINFVSLDFAKAECAVHLHAYSKRGAGWKIAPIAKRAPRGVAIFAMPDQLKAKIASAIAREARGKGARWAIAPIIDRLADGFGLAIEDLLGRFSRQRPGVQQTVSKIQSYFDRGTLSPRTKESFQEAWNETVLNFGKTGTPEEGGAVGRLFELLCHDAKRAQILSSIIIELAVADIALVRNSIGPWPELRDLIESPWDRLTTFLFVFRSQLAAHEEFKDAILFADHLAGRRELAGFSMGVALRLDYAANINEFLVTEAEDRKLSKADQEKLAAYLAYLRDIQLAYTQMALTSNAMRESQRPKLNSIFVPLNIREPDQSEKGSQSVSRREKVINEPKAPPDGAQGGDGEQDKGRDQSDQTKIGSVLTKHKRLALLAPVGSGKTTVLRWMALAFAEGRSEAIAGWSLGNRVPIYFRLGSFAVYLQSKSDEFFGDLHNAPIAFLANYYNEGRGVALTQEFFRRLLEEGGCAVFMDGLDEVPIAQRQHVARIFAHFVQHFDIEHDVRPKSKRDMSNVFVLSSRPKGYEPVEGELGKQAGFVARELMPLSRDGIRELIEKVLDYIDPQRIDFKEDFLGLTNAIERSSDLTRLASTPLFCTSLVQVYKYHGADLPERRIDVFEEIVNLLLGFWNAQDQKSRGQTEEDYTAQGDYVDLNSAVEKKRRRIGHLALQMQLSGKRTQIDQSSLIEFLSKYMIEHEGSPVELTNQYARKFLLSAQESSGLLVNTDPSEPTIYSFSHEGFREFLVADALRNDNLEADLISEILQRIDDTTWEEIIVLVGSYRRVSDAFRRHLLDECIKAANACRIGGDVTGWARRLVMAGRMAHDMGGYLALSGREQIKRILQTAVGDGSVDVKHRLEIALLLDNLGWLANDLHAFVEVTRPDSDGIFYIGKHPVANGQYRRFLDAQDFADRELWLEPDGADPRDSARTAFLSERWLDANKSRQARRPKFWDDAKFGMLHAGLPVVGISWFEANAYCRWLVRHWSELAEAGANPNLVPKTIRLPTEEEWYLAIAGEPQTSSQGLRPAASSPRMGTEANIGQSLDQTSPLGMFLESATERYGLMDARGNVWEWQRDYYDRSLRTIALRGGSFTTLAKDDSIDLRASLDPSNRERDVGLRLVLEP